MLACLGLSALFLAQRGSGSVAPKRVTGAYFRMHDPEFVAQTLQNADTPSGRLAAASVLTPEALAQRSRLLESVRPYLSGVEAGRGRVAKPSGSGKETAGAVLPKVTDGGPIKAPSGLVSFGRLPISIAGKGSARYFGAVARGAAAPHAFFHCTAAKDGTIQVLDSGASPFYLVGIQVETGEVDDAGHPKTKGYGSSKSVPVQAGQDYVVEAAMSTEKEGDFKGAIVVDDGSTNTLGMRGRVVAATGELGFWNEECGVVVAARTSKTFNLHVHLTSTGATTINVTGTSSRSGVKVATPYPVQAHVGVTDQTVPITVSADADAEDGTGVLTFTATAFDGKQKVTAEGAVAVQTIWTVSPIVVKSDGDLMTATQVRYADSGVWSVSSTMINLTERRLRGAVGFTIEAPIFEQVGWIVEGFIDAKKTKTFENHGIDFNLKSPAFTGKNTKNWGMFSRDFQDDPTYNQWVFNWYKTVANFTPFNVG